MPTTTTTTTVTDVTTTTVTTTTPTTTNNRDWKVIATAGVITIYIVVLFYAFFWAYHKVDNGLTTISVYWKNKEAVTLAPGPSWFYYNNYSDSIMTSKPITDLDKLNLLVLAKEGTDSSNSFKNAISQLSFESNKRIRTSYLNILILTAICGMLGVQLRTINNFIGVTCFKNEFNYNVWWPWYFVRPFIGLLVGPIVFIIFDGKLIPLSGQLNYSNTLVIAISILAGFAAEDVLNTLRTISKRLFGYKGD